MPKYRVHAVKRIYLTTVIEANSLEEAEKFADYELITDDFAEENTDFTLEPVVELVDCCKHDSDHQPDCDCCQNLCNTCSTLLEESL